MGTRSTVKFVEDGMNICSIYQQYDGYPEGVGADLADMLAKTRFVNGYTADDEKEGGVANGLRCFAAQYIAKIKTSIGNVYMTTAEDVQEYNYVVEAKTPERNADCWNSASDLTVTVRKGSWSGKEETLFKGTPAEFVIFCVTGYEGESE